MRKSNLPRAAGLSLAFGLLLWGPGTNATHAATFAKFDRYLDCIRDVSIDPRQGYERASTWRASGGGPGAMHCEALALSAMGVYPSAAKLLLRIAALPEIEDPKQRADLYVQAGHAFILAGKNDRALKAFSAGLEHVDLNSEPLAASELHIGRARSFGMKQAWADAIAELNLVLATLPQYDEAILIRASMYRASGDLGACAVDLANYLTLWPNDPSGLLERGLLMMDVFNLEGAKADFERVMDLAPKSAAAAKAQTVLAKLRFREDMRSGDLASE